MVREEGDTYMAKNIMRSVLIGGTILLVAALALVPEADKPFIGQLFALWAICGGIIGFANETDNL